MAVWLQSIAFTESSQKCSGKTETKSFNSLSASPCLRVTLLYFLLQMAVIPTVRRARRVQQKHTQLQSRISAAVTRWGRQPIVLVSIKMVLCCGRHSWQLASRVNLPVWFTAYYKDTPYWPVNGIMFWIVTCYSAKEWFHPNALES